jgi:hypothetical protein
VHVGDPLIAQHCVFDSTACGGVRCRAPRAAHTRVMVALPTGDGVGGSDGAAAEGHDATGIMRTRDQHEEARESAIGARGVLFARRLRHTHPSRSHRPAKTRVTLHFLSGAVTRVARAVSPVVPVGGTLGLTLDVTGTNTFIDQAAE